VLALHERLEQALVEAYEAFIGLKTNLSKDLHQFLTLTPYTTVCFFLCYKLAALPCLTDLNEFFVVL
jgi:hypothetical protein